MSNQVLERFHRALIEEIQTQRPEYLTGPFTVAEIYQNLVPYGSHRDRIGVEMNGDYEDALLRLLAGELEYLILDSEPARQAFQAEVGSPNPNTGLYREFAAVDVRLNPAYLDLSASVMDQLSDLIEDSVIEDPLTMTDLATSSAPAAELGLVPPGADIFSEAEAPAAAGPVGASDDPQVESAVTAARSPLAPEFVAEESEPVGTASGSVPGQCPWCSETLPDRISLKFCPFCGTDQSLVPCSSCGSEIEPGWSFCASCGASSEG